MTARPDIFLSYNREDQVVAARFAEAFAAEGLNVWWDTALRSGEAYDEVTEAALRAAKAVVVLWSPRSVLSRWVRAEATIADRCKTLVPVMIEPCERPIMFELTQTADLSHWSGDAADKAWQAFLADVRRFVGRHEEARGPSPGLPLPQAPTVQETLRPGQSGSAPSLAVLPFTNRSQLPEDDVFAEGMVEDVISALSHGANVRVLGSSATANLSRAAISDLAEVGRLLGVRYLLEGNVRRVGLDLRVTTQLLEAATGEVLWTGKFDRPLSELAALQEELVTEVAASLDTQLNILEVERALAKPDDLTAWQASTLSYSAFREYDPEALSFAIEHAERAVAMAPQYGFAQATLAAVLGAAYLVHEDDPDEVERIRATARRALALAPEDANVLCQAATGLAYIGDVEEGARLAVRASDKVPGSGFAHFVKGVALTLASQPERALPAFETARRLMSGSYLMVWIECWRANSLYLLGRWEEWGAAIDTCISLYPKYGLFQIFKARLCLEYGQKEEAQEFVMKARRLGWEMALSELHWRRTKPNSPWLESDLTSIRELYAATEGRK